VSQIRRNVRGVGQREEVTRRDREKTKKKESPPIGVRQYRKLKMADPPGTVPDCLGEKGLRGGGGVPSREKGGGKEGRVFDLEGS